MADKPARKQGQTGPARVHESGNAVVPAELAAPNADRQREDARREAKK